MMLGTSIVWKTHERRIRIGPHNFFYPVIRKKDLVITLCNKIRYRYKEKISSNYERRFCYYEKRSRNYKKDLSI